MLKSYSMWVTGLLYFQPFLLLQSQMLQRVFIAAVVLESGIEIAEQHHHQFQL